MSLYIQGSRKEKKKSHRTKRTIVKKYLYDFWNICDLFSYLTLYVGVLARHLRKDENETYEEQGGEVYPWQVYPNRTARRIFPFSLLIMYIRFLTVFPHAQSSWTNPHHDQGNG